ncbi:MAG TPA: SDR family oxidoreductase [Candidatus Thermoplasmatota archaeon]|nr:SDR family oxidoreductase [Candidatus Thermoplasmatota archaeon]
MAAMRDAVEARPRPVVLVTGCSTGIGREAVSHLERAGFLVIATARRVEAVQDLASPGKVEADTLDVTKAADRKRVVEGVLSRHGRIDALVNNAGYGAVLAVEDTDPAVMQAMFDTNVFGLHELSRLVLPTMRRQGSGRIVNVASIAGHVSVPMLGAYCATKFAVRALTQALDNEVRGFGVRAVLIEPGVIRTEFGNRSMAEHRTAMAAGVGESPYARLYRRWERMRMLRGGAHPRVIARAIVHACASASPRFHNFAPLQAKASNLAKRLLPDAVVSAGMRIYFRGR